MALLEPEVPGSKVAAGHVRVALPTPSCQVGVPNLQFCRVQRHGIQAYWRNVVSGSNGHIMVHAQADVMQETKHTQSSVGFNMSCCLKGAMLEHDYNAEVLLMSLCLSDTSAPLAC